MAGRKLSRSDKEALDADQKREELDAENHQKRIRIRALLQECEPVAFSMLDRALKEERTSHAYLFQGPRGSLKKEMAFLLAESLLTDSRGLIDESQCDGQTVRLIRNIANGDNSSLIFLDGYQKTMISKEQIDDIQLRFSRTAAAGNGKKIYIIDHFENSSEGAQNGLLKFLEEPSEGTMAVLTADNTEGILSTIRSRCVMVPFKPLMPQVYRSLAQQQGLDEEDAFFLSQTVSSIDNLAQTAASYAYQTAKRMMRQYLGIAGDRETLVMDYDLIYRIKPGKKSEDTGVKASDARDANMDILNYFFSMLACYCQDVLINEKDGPAWYHEAVERGRKEPDYRSHYGNMIRILVEERDLVNRNNDLNLLFAQAMYRLEVTQK